MTSYLSPFSTRLSLKRGWVVEYRKGETWNILYGYLYLHQLFNHAIPDYTGWVTVPLIWDRVQETIVSKKSSEIIRIYKSALGDLSPIKSNYYPPELKHEIYELNALNMQKSKTASTTADSRPSRRHSNLASKHHSNASTNSNPDWKEGIILRWEVPTKRTGAFSPHSSASTRSTYTHFKTKLKRKSGYPVLRT